MAKQKQPKGFTYAIAAHMGELPPEFPTWIRRYDVHASFRRPSFDASGNRRKDEEGRPTWDTSTMPVRDLFRYAERGWELDGPFTDAPQELVDILKADARGASLLPQEDSAA